MLTNNYKKMAMYHVVGDYTSKRILTQSLVNTNGDTVTTYNPASSSYASAVALGNYLINPRSAASIAAGYVYFGDGNTTPIADDYTLSGNIIVGLTFETKFSATEENDGVRISAVYKITNNNSNAITISEVGIFGYGYRYDGYPDSSLGVIMLERSLLDYPVTIEAGAFGEVTYEIKVYYPTLA